MILLSNSWNQITPMKTSQKEVEKILGTPERKFLNVQYSKSSNLELWSYDEMAISIYLKDNKVQFFCIGPNSKNCVANKGEEWLKQLGTSDEPFYIQSNMGANVCIKIFGQKGLALHVECIDLDKKKFGVIDFIEIFPPMSFDTYMNQFYKDTQPPSQFN